jgi:hypothetical protein
MQKLPIPPVEKIHIYQNFHIDRSLLAESFAKLTVRQEPLKLEEAQKVGLETMLQISQARELSRGSNSGTKPASIRLNDSELRSVIQDAFGLEEDTFIDFQVGDFFSFMRISLMSFLLSLQRRALANRSNRKKRIPPPPILVDARARSEQLRGKVGVPRCCLIGLHFVLLLHYVVLCLALYILLSNTKLIRGQGLGFEHNVPVT